MSQKQPRYRFSWFKPWAFNTLYDMRRTLTESEVYRKLKILERHSSFKKPYRNYQAHPHGELYYSPSGFPRPDPPGGGYFPDGGVPPPRTGGCAMACLGGIIDCNAGGCHTLTCVCGEPYYTVAILEDPTGQAWSEDAINPRICVPPQSIEDDYPTIVAVVIDAQGQQSLVEINLVDCADCCESFTITGSATKNPGTIWEGTVDPPCPAATCNVVSNSGCDLGCSMTSDGGTVSVVIGDSDCGSFTVTVVSEQVNCASQSANFVVRINDTGQGGAWVEHTAQTNPTCHVDCNTGCGLNYGGPCTVNDTGLKYGREGAQPCVNQYYRSCIGLEGDGCAEQGAGGPPCTGMGTCAADGITYAGDYCLCTKFVYQICEWQCTC